MMKRFFGGFVILIYLVATSALTHAQSMDVFESGDNHNNHDSLTHCVITDTTQSDKDCFSECFLVYDQASHSYLLLEKEALEKAKVVNSFSIDIDNCDFGEYDGGEKVSDDRGVVIASNMPYFSHKDLIKQE